MTKIYNQFSKNYNKLFKENLILFQKNILKENPNNARFNVFYPSFGIKANKFSDFLIIGQVVNGWRTGFDLTEKINENKIKESIMDSNCYLSEMGHNPIDWVNVCWSNSIYSEHTKDKKSKDFYAELYKYRAYRSFFWNVTFKLISDYYPLDRESWKWSKKIVWSNLYKIAKKNKNPNDYECQMQQPTAFELIKTEIEEINPKYCIVITNGKWWEPFQSYLKTKSIDNKNLPSEIVFVEKYKKTIIIVTTRPPLGNGETHVKQILEIINSK